MKASSGANMNASRLLTSKESFIEDSESDLNKFGSANRGETSKLLAGLPNKQQKVTQADKS